MIRLLFTHPDWLLGCAAVLLLTGSALTAATALSLRRSRLLLGETSGAHFHRMLPDGMLFAALLFLLVSVPVARFTDWYTERDRKRKQAVSV